MSGELQSSSTRADRRVIPRFMLTLFLLLAAASAHADMLCGHLSGLVERNEDVDLRVRFFDNASTDSLLAEYRFDAVDLRDGHFRVAMGHIDVPSSARFVEIALRPSARPYAAFRTAPPRRRLRRANDNVLVAGLLAAPAPLAGTHSTRTRYSSWSSP